MAVPCWGGVFTRYSGVLFDLCTFHAFCSVSFSKKPSEDFWLLKSPDPKDALQPPQPKAAQPPFWPSPRAVWPACTFWASLTGARPQRGYTFKQIHLGVSSERRGTSGKRRFFLFNRPQDALAGLEDSRSCNPCQRRNNKVIPALGAKSPAFVRMLILPVRLAPFPASRRVLAWVCRQGLGWISISYPTLLFFIFKCAALSAVTLC